MSSKSRLLSTKEIERTIMDESDESDFSDFCYDSDKDPEFKGICEKNKCRSKGETTCVNCGLLLCTKHIMNCKHEEARFESDSEEEMTYKKKKE